jgi:hypothetical protein
MRKEFAGYYRPSDSEFDELWSKARIIVDANVLLAVYGVSPSTREALLRLLEIVKDRLWIPHHFALEYQKNRLGKILEQVKHYEDAHRDLKTILDDQFRSRTRHPFVSVQIEVGLEEICKSLLDGRTEQQKLVDSDPHFERMTQLFEGNVGAPYGEVELSQTYEVARKRFSEKIPPGFRDADKPEPARFGDYVGWRQILDFACKNNASVILVSDDSKDDWWRKEGTQTYGPRPELIVEFHSCCSALFYMYSSDRFLELSGKYLGGIVDPRAISELKERRESEPAASVMKSSATDHADSQAIKPTGYITGPELNEEKQSLAAPKLSGQDVAKSEEE